MKSLEHPPSSLSSIEHLNLVKLIGYAEEGPERVLVVEYIANGNLREHLDGTSNLKFFFVGGASWFSHLLAFGVPGNVIFQ